MSGFLKGRWLSLRGRGPDYKGLPVPPQSAADVQRTKLAHLFRAAVYEGSCRTLAFSHEDESPSEKSVYLKAVQLSPDNWRVVRVVRGYLTGVSEATGNFEVERYLDPVEDLTFFEAMDRLAMFDKGLTGADCIAVEPTKEQLGISHYEAFARREGLAIDTLGLPHPTVKGEIVTKGDFLPGEGDNVRAAYTTRAALEKKIILSLPPARAPESQDQDVMTAEKLDAWSKDLAERATIISHAKSGLIALMIDMAFEHDEKAVKPRKLKRKVIHDRLVACGYTPEQKEIVRSYTVFKDYDSRIFDKLVDAYARDAKTDGPHADYGRIVSIAAFHYYVAKAHYHVHTQNPDSKDARIIISYVKKAKEALAKTGVSEAAVAAVDDLVRAAHPPEYPRHVLRHIAAIEEEHDREQKRLDQARSVFAESLKKTREPLMLTGGTIRPPS